MISNKLKIISINRKELIEIYLYEEKKDYDAIKLDKHSEKNQLNYDLIEEGNFSSIIFDQELKLIILSKCSNLL